MVSRNKQGRVNSGRDAAEAGRVVTIDEKVIF
jgi:hypothetical protein